MSDIYEITSGEPLPSSSSRQYLSQWPETRKESISPRTHRAYAQVARDFISSLGPKADRDISQISRVDVTKYRDQKAAETSIATANKHLKYLRVGLGAAWKDGFIQDNPAAKVDLLPRRKGDYTERRPFTLDELKSILKHASEEWRSIILFGFYTGQRLGDICALRWSNIDLQEDVIRFVTGKTGRRMEIPIAAPLARHIESMPSSDNPDDPLFPGASPIAKRDKSDSRLSQAFYDIMTAAGLAKARNHAAQGQGRSTRRAVNEISFHSLRHTATSLLKSAGVGEAIAMDIIGHDSAAISRHYTHIEPKAKRRALKKLPDITE